MGVVASKSPLERRNSVLRRSQRRSIHKIKSKVEQTIKEIKKFKGTNINSDYAALKQKIEAAERELSHFSKNLQPQIGQVYKETLEKVAYCHRLLSDKLKDNQVVEPPEDLEGDDDVFIEEEEEEVRKLEESTEKRKTVELNLIRVEPIEASPQINKRFSAAKMGVPVMPGSMLEALQHKSEEVAHLEGKVARIRAEIEKVEEDISRFVGRKNGRQYDEIRKTLEDYSDQLKNISSDDENVKLCRQYIGSCLSFLDEKAGEASGEDTVDNKVEGNLSPRSIRTTYI